MHPLCPQLNGIQMLKPDAATSYQVCSKLKWHTKCSLQDSSVMIGGQFELDIAARLLFPAFATIRGSTSLISV